MERGEVGRGLGVFPRRLAHGVDDERGAHDHHAADDQHREPDGVAAGRNLTGRHEAQDEGQQCAAETEASEEPHQAVLFAQAERTGRALHLVAQDDGGREHQHVHDQVQQHGQLREDLVERLHRGHHDEQQRQQRHDAALDQQDVLLYAVLVGLLEERGQVTGLAHGEDTLRGTRHPRQHACQHAEHQGDGDDRAGPRNVEVVEVVVEPD